jgi:hypothetical protein
VAGKVGCQIWQSNAVALRCNPYREELAFDIAEQVALADR